MEIQTKKRELMRNLFKKTKERYIISSESVNIGHPDKTCDVIADSFLDEALAQDPMSMMAVECAIKDNTLFIYGEATTKAKIDYEEIARKKLKEIGYDCEFKIVKKLSKQSVEIGNAVLQSEISANDQGIMYGYASDETDEYMPMPITIAHSLMRTYDEYRKKNKKYCPDAKAQVSIEYEDGNPKHIETILLSVSHKEGLKNSAIAKTMKEEVIAPTLQKYIGLVDENTKYIINPSGSFTIWGSFSDSGCVGRKIVVDTYGGVGRVGGGCFSSKNPTKVDRSGAYYARFVAKNIVANGLAKRCEIQVAYGIGLSKPISIYIDTFGTEKVKLSRIYDIVNTNFDFSVGKIIESLNLTQPIYTKTACFGHFGNPEYPWEKIIELKK